MNENPWWYIFGFPFLMMFRMAVLFYNLLSTFISTGNLPYSDVIGLLIPKIIIDAMQWIYWWLRLLILQLLYYSGLALAPYSIILAPYFDFKYVSTGKLPRWKMSLTPGCLLTLDSRLCIMSDVINISSSSLAFLRRKLKSYRTSVLTNILTFWNKKRENVGAFPPHGWPLQIFLALFASGTIFCLLFTGYLRILQQVWSTWRSTKNEAKLDKRLACVFETVSDEAIKLKSELFDTDSETCIMDNSANCIIWRSKSAFIRSTYVELDPSKFYGITTAIGTGNPVGVGDIKVGWYDDNNIYHNFILKDAFHIPNSAVNVIGISELSKNVGDFKEKGTRIDSSGSDSILRWNNKKFVRSFIHPDSCLPEMPVNDGFSKFHNLCNFVDKIQPVDRQCYHNEVRRRRDVLRPISPDEVLRSCPYDVGEAVIFKDSHHFEKGVIEDIKVLDYSNTPVFDIKLKNGRKEIAQSDQITTEDETDLSDIPVTHHEFLENARYLSEEDLKKIEHPLPLSPIEVEWKRLHDRHGHISFTEMDKLVECGIFPTKFECMKGKSILCPSCIFGKMRKRKWRNKGKKSGKIRKESMPGKKVSTDQLVVAQPGLVPRMSGRHTNERVCGATGFFDHYSGYSYSALQTSLDGEQTLVAKMNFEAHADQCGVIVDSYRADNGRFAEQSFIDAVKEAHQTIDFCAVGAHHQNGVIERHFQRLTSSARTILLHAKRHWPSMITTVLWPFAYKYAELLYNHLHIDAVGLSPAEKFCETPVKLQLNDFHTWGCPCYVLDSRAQQGNMVPKWDPRSRLGIYVGHSPCHVGSVALVLNPKTLHFSP